jgi:hypothetical protein
MSYTADDYFFDVIAPKMAEIFKKYDPQKANEDLLDKFKEIIKGEDPDNRGFEKFRREIIQILLDPYDEKPTVDKIVFDLCAMLFEDYDLRKLEYSSGSSVISIDYHVLIEE